MLPAPTTMSPASSTALIGARRLLQRGVEALGRQRRGRRARRPARPAGRARRGRRPGRATTPRRRSGAGRSGAACRGRCARSKWSCGPGGGAGPAAPASPTCPGAAAARRGGGVGLASSKGSHKYLPRRVTAPTVRPASSPGSRPAASAAACPGEADCTRAPRSGSSMPRRVTSTSGSSGMNHYVRMTLDASGAPMPQRRLAGGSGLGARHLAVLVVLGLARAGTGPGPGPTPSRRRPSTRRSTRRCSTSC